MVSESYIDLLREGRRNTMNLSFAGCGFLGIYHVGVASCIREYAPHLAADKISGASAGAIAAVGLVCDCDLGEATTQVLQVALKARSYTLGPLHPTFNIVDFLKGLLDDFLPFNAHVVASGRVHISLTRMSDRQNVVVNQFETREDLIQALICSAYIPFYCGLIPPKYKGTYYLDGGMSDNIPILDDSTITVSPFAGESDICPKDVSGCHMNVNLVNTSIQISSSNLYRFGCIVFPPSPETLSKMCQQGFDDCLTFLQNNKLISCARHLSIYSSITSSKSYDNFSSKDTNKSYTTNETIEEEDETDNNFEDQSENKNSEELSLVKRHGTDLVLSSSTSGSSASSGCTMTSLDSWCDNDDVTHTCEECANRRTLAVPDNLPVPVVTALQAACDSVNSGMLGRLRTRKAYRVLSLMAVPMYLPVEISYSLCRRFAEWVPYMPEDMQWFAREFIDIARVTHEFVKAARHRYSARLTCQLAITELDGYDDHEPKGTGVKKKRHLVPRISPNTRALAPPKRHLNVGFSMDLDSRRASNPLEYVGEVRHRLLEGEDDVYLHELPPVESCELDSDAIPEPPEPFFALSEQPGSGSSSYGASHSRSSSFPASTSGSGGNLSNVTHHHHHHHRHSHGGGAASGGGGHHHHHHDNHTRRRSNGSMHDAPIMAQSSAYDPGLAGTDIAYDTFENCLHVADQMDSILTYYYADEDNPNVIRVAEIYPLNDLDDKNSSRAQNSKDNEKKNIRPRSASDVTDKKTSHTAVSVVESK